VAYCSTCDAPFYKGKDVAVIGGGNAGLEAVLDLVPYASSIKLLIREELPQGDPQTIEEINEIEKVRTIANADAKEILGDKKVSGIKYMNLVTGETRELDVEGVFVEVGVVPNSEIVKGLVELNGRKEIKIVSPCTGETSKKGIYAAGDVTEEMYKQNNIAAGDAIKATLSAYKYLMELKKNLRKKGNLED
jgi:alkyl hydroperoxide reductase subunit F